MTELVWDGKYKDGKKQGPVRIALPFQTIETVNESAQDRQKSLELFSAGREPEWRNRLIWGDKKYVLPSLLPEFAGKVDLIYIDPPFDTGADFSFNATIPDLLETEEDEAVAFTKQPSILEQKAYRDTWGRGVDSYLQWLYETLVLLREFLTETGSLYVHCGPNVNHAVRAVLDEVFGAANFANEIIWRRAFAHSDSGRCGIIHDCLLLYGKTDNRTWNKTYQAPSKEYIETFFDQYDDKRRERYARITLTAPGNREGRLHWPKKGSAETEAIRE